MTRSRRNNPGYNRLGAADSNSLDEPLTPVSSADSLTDGSTGSIEGTEMMSQQSTIETTTTTSSSSSRLETNNNNNSSSNNNSAAAAADSTTTTSESSKNNNKNKNKNSFIIPDGYIEVIILDTLHNRFKIAMDPDWTVEEFKSHAASIHHVPASSQRLIYMGKLLQNENTMRDFGIIKSDTILHLFPKPNVVISDSATMDNNNNSAPQPNGSTSSTSPPLPTGAHVPQIILDAEEARRASSTVIFTSTEMFEAQHRVKLLSFLLLVICSMELLTLLTIMLGVPDDGGYHDDVVPPGDPTDSAYNEEPVPMRQWRNSDYADLALSGFGFYVATLGIKATAENTLVSAKRYYAGLVVVGVSWVAYYYYLGYDNARQKQEDGAAATDDNDEARDNDDDDDSKANLYTQALAGIVLPVCVWVTCFLRAWQFQRLIGDAEREGEARLESLNQGIHQESSDEGDDDLRLREEDIIV